MRTIAIGDIHGCAAALAALLPVLQITADDVVIPLGDSIDRGPDSRGVVEQMLALQTQCQLVPLLGNHEIMLLDVLADRSRAYSWLQFGGVATMDSYGTVEQIPESHIQFFRNCRRYYETDDYIFLHANYDPALPMEQQSERLLFWEHLLHRVPKRHTSGKTIIAGHTPQMSGEILDAGHLLCIDTYCFGSGWLTALDVHSREIWQADKHGRLRSRA